MSLKKYLCDKTSILLLDNAQARMLLPKSMTLNYTPLEQSLEPMYHEMLKKRLNYISLAGLTERIEIFQERLSQLLGLEIEFPHLNKTSVTYQGIELDEETLSIIKERSWLDRWLYDFVAEENGLADSINKDDIFQCAIDRYRIKLTARNGNRHGP